jgi:small-conductance mechanosensitive channel
VPITADLDRVRELLVAEARAAREAMPEKEPIATVSNLEASSAVVTIDAWARTAADAGRLAAAIRDAAQRRLRAEGVFA